MVSPALQRRGGAGALPRAAPAHAVPRPRREGRRPGQGPDRVRQRRSLGAGEIRRRTGQTGTDVIDAAGSLQRPDLRMELVAVCEEREVMGYPGFLPFNFPPTTAREIGTIG